MQITKEFNDALSSAALFAMENDNFAIISHYDADGLCAASIVAKALEREGKSFKIRIVKQLYRETMEEIKSMGKNFIFSDFGSGQIEIVKENFQNFLILDHHQSPLPFEPLHINPFFFSVDGGNEISGAGMCYLFAKALNPKNSDLSALAIIGAVGDMQDFSGSLIGINREIMADAEAEKILTVSKDLRLYGRISRPLVQFIEFSSSPVIPGLTANEKACIKFIAELGIELKEREHWKSYNDLSKEEKRLFSSSLILHMHEQKVPEWKIRELIGEVYTLNKEPFNSPLRDAKEFATLLNSCGRHQQPEVALAVCMGDREENYSKAVSLMAEHRKQLREGIEFIHKEGIEEFKNFYFFDAKDVIKESIVGIIAGMLYGSNLLSENKPIIAMALNEDGSAKVSGRGTKYLVNNGLNLGKTFKEICAELSDASDGGGHKIAAGCKIKPEHKERFLKLLDSKLAQGK